MSSPPLTVTYQIDPTEMARRGRLGALAQHARHDPQETTRKAREAFAARFQREVDPDGVLSDEERERRIREVRRAHFSQLGALSAQVRRERAGDAR